MILTMRGRTVTFPRRPLVMGIVNVTDDSFSGDGSLKIEQRLKLRDATSLPGPTSSMSEVKVRALIVGDQ